jgi:hypothetical protein
VALQPQTLGNAGLGIEVRGQCGFQLFGNSGRVGAGRSCQLGKAGEAGGRSTQGASDVEQIAGASAGAQQGAASGNSPDQDDIRHGYRGFGQIAASQRG